MGFKPDLSSTLYNFPVNNSTMASHANSIDAGNLGKPHHTALLDHRPILIGEILTAFSLFFRLLIRMAVDCVAGCFRWCLWQWRVRFQVVVEVDDLLSWLVVAMGWERWSVVFSRVVDCSKQNWRRQTMVVAAKMANPAASSNWPYFAVEGGGGGIQQRWCRWLCFDDV